MKMLGHKLNDEELEECIKMVDADGGGSVDIDEFMELMRTKTKEAQDEVEVKEAFRVLDKVGKGEIHTDVIKELLQKLDDTLSEEDLGDLIAEIDSDGSGWVDYDEFKALMLGQFGPLMAPDGSTTMSSRLSCWVNSDHSWLRMDRLR